MSQMEEDQDFIIKGLDEIQAGNIQKNIQPLNFELLMDEFDDNREFVTGMLHRFFINAQLQINEMKILIDKKDFENIKKEAHSLKGGANCIFASPLGGIALQLEEESDKGDIHPLKSLYEELCRKFHELKTYALDKIQ